MRLIHQIALDYGLIGRWSGQDSGLILKEHTQQQQRSGTLQGTALWVEGPVPGSKAVYLDGTSGTFVNIGDLAPYKFTTQDFSVSAWVNLLDGTGDNTIMAKFGTVGQKSWTFIFVDARLFVAVSGEGSGNSNLQGATTVSLGRWYHCGFSHNYAANSDRLYLNGIDDGSGASVVPVFDSTAPLVLGRRSDQNSEYINGFIGETRLYNRVLSPMEFAALADPVTLLDRSHRSRSYAVAPPEPPEPPVVQDSLRWVY